MTNNKRGIGDNSVQDEGTFKSLADVIAEISNKLWNVRRLINEAKDTHTASHGDVYYFEHEISDAAAETARVLQRMPDEGVERRPNPYEKKAFAGATTNTLADAAEETVNLVAKLGNIKKQLNKKDEVSNGN